MIVRLYDLPDSSSAVSDAYARGVTIRRALPADRNTLREFVVEHFTSWTKETAVAFEQSPCLCFLAMRDGRIVGFAAYDVAAKNFFGPTGVAKAHCGQGIGKALLLVTLEAQAAQGYAYAIIGGVGPEQFYRTCVDAQLIEGSSPGIYVSAEDSSS